MRYTTTLLLCCLFLPPLAHADNPDFGPGSPARHLGGLMIIRQGNQKTVSLGGILFSRRVTVTTTNPEGQQIARFTLPSALHSPVALPLPGAAPAFLQVEIPDPDAVLHIEGQSIPIKGALRQLQSPVLAPGAAHPVHLRSAFRVGDNLFIEDKQVLLRAGELTSVKFDGAAALIVPLPNEYRQRP